MIKNKLISARKQKGLSQKEMAGLAFMDQSQYSRREKGISRFSEEEWERFAKILEKETEEIFEEDATINITNDNGSNGSVNYSDNVNFYNIPDFMLKNQQDYIEHLKKEIAELKNKVN